jgi:hypothetical protein
MQSTTEIEKMYLNSMGLATGWIAEPTIVEPILAWFG